MDVVEEVALHRKKKLSTINGTIEFQSPKNGLEEELSKINNGDSCLQFESSNYHIPQDNTLNSSVYSDQPYGTESVDGIFEMKNDSVTSSTSGTSSEDVDVNNMNDLETKESLIAEMNDQCTKNVNNKGFSYSSLAPLDESLEEQNVKDKSVNNETKLVGDFESLEEIDQEETEFDVERVIEKQNTHDLYCPNCNSCITKRVILRRKRKVRNTRRKPKYNKVEAKFSSNLDADSTNSANIQVQETVEVHPSDSPALAASNQNSDREAEVFGCLSCFSIFIPTGDGFKLFRLFGNGNDNENMQNLQKMPSTNRNWFLSIFKPVKKETAVEQGNETLVNQNAAVSSTVSPSLGLVHEVGTSASQQASKEIYFENVSTHIGQKSDNATVKLNSAAVMDAVQEGDSQSSSDNVIYQHEKGHSEISGTAMAGKQAIQNGQPSVIGTQLPTKLLGAGELLKDSVVVRYENRTDVITSSSQETLILKNVTNGIEEAASGAIQKKDTGHDVIVVVETPLDPAASQAKTSQVNDSSMGASSLLQSGTQIHTSEQRSAGITVDILKSIVYGGLVESITSLGVVSSAAGAGSATLNILALGLANLIGGLFIIGHNLIDLKNDTSNQTSEHEDRYQEMLGRRENFKLHAPVAILSFLIFGMMAPVIYSFSFRKSDDKDLKLAAVSGASLVCILLLAIGKAHVRRPPRSYITTVLYYVIMGIMASGISYVVGDLLSMLMEKLGWFQSSLAVTTIVPDTKPWASY